MQPQPSDESSILLIIFVFILVLPSSALQIASVQGGDGMLQSGGGGGGGTIVQYATQNQDGQFFVPGKLFSFHRLGHNVCVCVSAPPI